MTVTILNGDVRDVLATLPDGTFDCIVTSPRRPDGRFVKGVHSWRRHKPHWDKAWLNERYTVRSMSAKDIAAEAGCTENNIFHWLSRHGIQRRSMSEARSVKHWGLSGPDNPMYGMAGERNPRYVDGSSPERQSLYSRGHGQAFLSSIYARDNFSCVRCSAPKSGPKSLHVHHIKPWAGNEALRFDPANVVTLCRCCHQWVHSKKNTALEYLA